MSREIFTKDQLVSDGGAAEDPPTPSELSDAEVKTQLRAIEGAVRKHDSMLIGWLTKRLGDADTARDVAQDAYLRVWRRAHVAKIENPQAILFKTAANLAANEFRSRKRFANIYRPRDDDDRDDPIQETPCDAPSPERVSVARSDVALSMATIRDLPEKTRRAFIMNRFEEKSYSQIAEELNVSKSSIEKYMIVALASLREAFAKNASTGAVIRFPGKPKQ